MAELSQSVRSRADKPAVAFGPEMVGWGSWQWAGRDVAEELAKYFRTATFQGADVPKCDLVVFVKFPPPAELVEAVSRRAAVIYCPIDCYGDVAEIDADAAMLRRCSRIVVHCEGLARYFQSYAPVEYIDHHVKFVVPIEGGRGMGSHKRELQASGSGAPGSTSLAGASGLCGATQREGAGARDATGYVLWVGVRTNLPPLVEWVNRHPLPCELRLLTNLEDPAQVPTAEELGFRTTPHPGPLPHGERGAARPQALGGQRAIVVENWSAERQIELTAGARAAIDIKGDDFRSRHKPPAKAIDFIASGVPLAMDPGSNPVEHLARMGFDVASPLDIERWFSREYWEETKWFGTALRELLSRERIGRRWKRIIEAVLEQGSGFRVQGREQLTTDHRPLFTGDRFHVSVL